MWVALIPLIIVGLHVMVVVAQAGRSFVQVNKIIGHQTTVFIIILLVVVFETTVQAQQIPVFELSAGYTLLRDDIFDNAWPGWVASLTGN